MRNVGRWWRILHRNSPSLFCIHQNRISCAAGMSIMIAVFLFPLQAFSSSKISPKTVEYDFGRVAEGEVVRHAFEFANTGTDTLTVYHVQKSCGCSSASTSRNEVPPGETANIHIEFRTEGYTGEALKYITAYTNDPSNSSTQFKLKGTVAPRGQKNSGVDSGEETRLTILHTTDVHGQIYPTTYRGVPNQGGWAKVSTLIGRIRTVDTDLVLLDGGDAIEGSPMAFYTSGESAIRVMNFLKYDAMALGNHEFDVGQKALAERFAQAKFPILSANVEIDATVSLLPIPKPYTVLRIKGKKIGVLGLTPESTPRYLSKEQQIGVRFTSMVAAAKKYVPILRDKEKVDVVVVLVHGAYSKGDGILVEPVRQVAEEVPGIDVVIMGHSHDNVPEMLVRNAAGEEVLLTQAFRWGIVLGRIDLTFKGTALTEKRSMTIPVGEEIDPDSQILSLVSDVKTVVDKELSQVVGAAAMPFRNPAEYYVEGPLTDLALEALRSAGKTEIALFGWDNMPRGLDAGDITGGEIYDLFPYDDEIEIIRMSGLELKKVLEAGAEELGSFRDWNFVAAAGVTYVLDPAAPIGLRIQNLKYRGEPVRADQQFEVAVNSFQAAGAAKGTMKDLPRVRTLEGGFRQAMMDYVKDRKTITPKISGWWTVKEPSSAAAHASSGKSTHAEDARRPASKPVNINTARAEELDAVPYVSRNLAQEIVRVRHKVGRFGSLQDLLTVPGIGKRKLELLAPYLTLEPAQSAVMAGMERK